ncbi:Fc.00g071560.m01.CDS01 [Cosmosporella sp. VM-42]
MSGFEIIAVVGGVAAIISGFHASVELVRTLRKKRKLRKLFRGEDEKVENQLSRCAPPVQEEYDKGYSKLGPVYAKGDDIGRSQLQTELITLQQSVILLLQNALSETAIDITPLTGTSITVQRNVITALIQQFQRLSVAEPIREITIVHSYKHKSACEEAYKRGYNWIARANYDYSDHQISFSKDDYMNVRNKGRDLAAPAYDGWWDVFTKDRRAAQAPNNYFNLLCMARVDTSSQTNPGSTIKPLPFGFQDGDLVTLKARTPDDRQYVVETADGSTRSISGRHLSFCSGKAKANRNRPETAEDVALKEGTTVRVMRFDSKYKGWWTVRNHNNEEGIAPMNALELLG